MEQIIRAAAAFSQMPVVASCFIGTRGHEVVGLYI
jgi:hypothetical protein